MQTLELFMMFVTVLLLFRLNFLIHKTKDEILRQKQSHPVDIKTLEAYISSIHITANRIEELGVFTKDYLQNKHAKQVMYIEADLNRINTTLNVLKKALPDKKGGKTKKRTSGSLVGS